MKKLLHVFPSLALGGSQKRLIDLLHDPILGSQHHLFICVEPKCEIESYFPSGLKYTIIPFEPLPFLPQRYVQMRKVLKELKPDVLLTYNWGAIEWGLANFPEIVPHYVHLEDGFGPDEQSSLKLHRTLFRRLVFTLVLDDLIVPSQTLAEIADAYWNVIPPMLHYIPNGIDIQPYQHKKTARRALLEKLGLRDESLFLYGSIARLRKEKNFPKMIEIFDKLQEDDPKARLVIMGSGPEEERLKAMVATKDLTDKVFFMGHISEPGKYLPGLDMFLLTSDTEQMPYSIVEAMASKVPIVSTDVGDVKAMLCPENAAFIAPKTDKASFIKKVKLLREDKAQQARLAELNAEKVKTEYLLETMREAHRRVYLEG